MSVVAHTRQVTISRNGQLVVDDLPVRAGDQVRVFILPEPVPASAGGEPSPRYPLHGVRARYDDPFEPAVDPDEWEANR